MLCNQLQRPEVHDNEFGSGYIGQIGPVSGLNFGYISPSPIEWRVKEHAKCMAAEDYSAAEEWLDEIERELKVARHWLGVAKSFAAQHARPR
jgi:hypothetical protein